MSAFHGGQGRGAARKRRELKRLEAEDRQRAHDIDVRATALMLKLGIPEARAAVREAKADAHREWVRRG